MRSMGILIVTIVLGASVAASAQVITRDQLRQWFSSNDTYSQGFRAGYAAGVADAARAAYANPGMITQGVTLCAQTRTFPYLLQLSNTALQQWLTSNDPRVIAAAQVLSAYNYCQDPGDRLLHDR